MKIGYGKNYYSNSVKADSGVRKIGKPPKIALFTLFLVCFSVLNAVQSTVGQVSTRAPAINVAAAVKPRHIQLGEKARLDLTISGDAFIKHIETPKFNFLPEFLAVPLHTETTPRLESNKIAVSMAWAYELIPQTVGDFSLPDVHFAYQGSDYFANPGSIRVSSADTYVDVSTRSIHQVEVSVDTTKPYLNAPLTYTFRYLYTAVLPTQESPTPRLPEFPNFLVEELPTLRAHTQQIRGKTFWVEEHVRKLYPQRTGQIVIKPATLMLPVPRGRKTLTTEPLTLNIQPLPEVGKPSNFSGAVGEYQISAQVDRTSVAVGSALTLSIQIAGRGNIQTVTEPKLPPIAGVVVNGPNLVEGSTPTNRTYAYALIPARSGTLRIPTIAYIYFDPSRAVYATAQTTPIPIAVHPNPNDVADTEIDAPSWKVWLIPLAILIVVLVGAGFLWYRARFQKIRGETVNPATGTPPSDNSQSSERKGQRTPAASQASEALRALAHGNTTDEATAFANALAQILYEYLTDTVALTQRNIDTVREACVQSGMAESILEELVDLLTKCEYHRFAPVPLTATERGALITRAEAVITDTEDLQNTYTG
ncbi:BatD family protein [Candidatus Poribacteria bacterium]|nr:BatD family protein [Candidatus Poribacteria bacterium]